ncbi:5'/3'-nucleotidase SurE [Alteromonas gilva]|uniref:5'-nucleotidase SurE n=1 Tax=Alteromonas gilva TaxID=2987522 RepID=A0ABT5KZD0_9ALTE|nr:5'/3'-nucleotidase SurE [Alteromonas gilva]MDC8830130.1 5'/3'-nucleotidase SurE [Alteromonas gilva]
MTAPSDFKAMDRFANKLCQRVLLTNDDGIHAVGLNHLFGLAAALADEVYLVAPEQDCSGQAQSLTLHTPLRVQAYDTHRYGVSGTPADCVLVGLKDIVPGPVDLVLSGINRGANVGDAVNFSGTLGAAKVAAQFGVPAIGLSQAFKHPEHIFWDNAITFTAIIVRQLLQCQWPKTPCVNVNFPAVPAQQVEGISWCEGSEGSIRNVLVDKRMDPRNRHYYWLDFEHDYKQVTAAETDIATMRRRHIAVQCLNQANPFATGIAVIPDFANSKKEMPYD